MGRLPNSLMLDAGIEQTKRTLILDTPSGRKCCYRSVLSANRAWVGISSSQSTSFPGSRRSN